MIGNIYIMSIYIIGTLIPAALMVSASRRYGTRKAVVIAGFISPFAMISITNLLALPGIIIDSLHVAKFTSRHWLDQLARSMFVFSVYMLAMCYCSQIMVLTAVAFWRWLHPHSYFTVVKRSPQNEADHESITIR
jgi:hypothetical protein